MKSKLFFIVIAIFTLSSAAADVHTIGKVVTQIGNGDRCIPVEPDNPYAGFGDIQNLNNVSEFIKIGIDVLEVIKKNKSTYNVARDVFHILPKGTTTPFELTEWKSNATIPVKLTIDDFLGFQLLELNYSVRFDYGGKYFDRGQYLANISVVPEKLDIDGIGMKVDLSATSAIPINIGSVLNPIPQIRLEVKTTIDGISRSFEKTDSIWIRGDGSYNCLPGEGPS